MQASARGTAEHTATRCDTHVRAQETAVHTKPTPIKHTLAGGTRASTKQNNGKQMATEKWWHI